MSDCVRVIDNNEPTTQGRAVVFVTAYDGNKYDNIKKHARPLMYDVSPSGFRSTYTDRFTQ